jgi:mannose-1-phosphate guanylyltransferase/mannose-6-phosphate isomerase
MKLICKASRKAKLVSHAALTLRQRPAAESAAADRIVTFGVRPTRPATEYGYIRAGASIGPDIFAIDKFVELSG